MRGKIEVLVLILSLFLAVTRMPAQTGPPGFATVDGTPVLPSEALTIRSQMAGRGAAGAGIGMPSTEITAEIASLARSLNYDVDLIYRYVHDQIEYTPIYGSMKGAVGTLLDGSGNDFDQASLMIALLRESNYSADFVLGTIRLYPAQLEGWLGTSDQVTVVSFLLAWAGIPHAPVDSNGDLRVEYIDLIHCWVKVDIDGSEYVFDPSLKMHSSRPGIDLATAMGYKQSTFLSRALSGATVTSNYIRSVNGANIDNDLADYAANLVEYIKSHHPSATLEDIVGGRSVIPVDVVPRQPSLPYQLSIIVRGQEIDDIDKAKVRIAYHGIDITLYTHEFYGKRLTISSNASNQPVLRLDGGQVAIGSPGIRGQAYPLTLSIDHPYVRDDGTFADRSVTESVRIGGVYSIVAVGAETGRNMVDRHRRRLGTFLREGGEDTSERVSGETLAMIGYAWLAGTSRAGQVADRIAGVFNVRHHVLGIVGQENSPFVSFVEYFSKVPYASDFKDSGANLFNTFGHASAFEFGALEQMQPVSAVSTVKVIGIANGKAERIYDATTANYSSAVRPNLVNYGAAELATLDAYIANGDRIILPRDGRIGQNDWVGSAYITLDSAESNFRYTINSVLNGGYADEPLVADPGAAVTAGAVGDQSNLHEQSAEPIDMVTGDYLYAKTDMSVGSAPFPFGFGFERRYNSGASLEDGAFGFGWSHNFDITATVDSDGFQGLGDGSPIDAAAAIVEQYVSHDILYNNKSKERIVIATLAQSWFMEQLVDNVVTVKEPGRTSKFVRLPDGSYNPPPGHGGTLTKEGDGTFLLRTKYGNELHFDAKGRLATWRDPNGNSVDLTYGDNGLRKLQNNLGRTLTFDYQNGRVSQISDGTGRTVKYSYDGAGNLVGASDPEGNATIFEYETQGPLTKVFQPSHPDVPFVGNTYDAMGRLTAQADAVGNVYSYYSSPHRCEERDPLGQSRVFHFDKRGNTILELDPLGNETTHTYDGQDRLIETIFPEGNKVAYGYDASHNLIRETLHPKPGSSEPPLTMSYTYDQSFSRIRTSTDPLNNTTTYAYDTLGNLIHVALPAVDAGVPQYHYTYNGRGQVAAIVDPQGMTTALSYEPLTGDLLSITVDNGGENIKTQFAYDTVGNITGVTDPRNNTTVYQYDRARRLQKVTLPPPYNHVTKYTWDENGDPTKIERETSDPLHPWETTLFSYTPSGKLGATTDAGGHRTAYEYDGADRLWKTTDPSDRTTQYSYDQLGRLYQLIDPSGAIVEEHTYTPNGQRASVKDAREATTHYTYDDFDRLSRIDFPGDSYRAFRYDAADNRIEQRTRSGQTIRYSYNALRQLVTKDLPASDSVQYAYDLSGRLRQVTDRNGTILHEYDTAGRLTKVTHPRNKTVQYEYDKAGNRTRLTYPDGYYVTYTYDSLNRLSEILEQGTTHLAQYVYDPLSRRSSLSLANGTSTDYAYDLDGNVTRLHHEFNDSAATFTYSYDASGNPTALAVDDNRYLFDSFADMDKLVRYETNSLNQYTAVNDVTYHYDLGGNLTSDGVHSYTYDAENQLIACPDRSANYTYDPFGRRTAKTVDHATTVYLHDGDRVIMEYDGASGDVLRRYVHGPGLDELVCMVAPSSRHYYHFDSLGSVIALSDESGAVEERYAYSPFGIVDEPSGIGNLYLYTGREHDEETGLYYYRARHYDPQLGRFLQPDPLGYMDGMNLYTYVDNSPLNWIDPFGLAGRKSVSVGRTMLENGSEFQQRDEEETLLPPDAAHLPIKVEISNFPGWNAERRRRRPDSAYEAEFYEAELERSRNAARPIIVRVVREIRAVARTTGDLLYALGVTFDRPPRPDPKKYWLLPHVVGTSDSGFVVLEGIASRYGKPGARLGERGQ